MLYTAIDTTGLTEMRNILENMLGHLGKNTWHTLRCPPQTWLPKHHLPQNHNG